MELRIVDLKESVRNTPLECFAFSLELNPGNPIDLSTADTRIFEPQKVSVFLENKILYVREIKNGKILKKKTKAKLCYKPDLRFFDTKESCIRAFNEEKVKALDFIQYYEKKLLELKTSIINGGNDL